MIFLLFSQYSVHHTRLRESPSGFVECNVRAKLQDIADITDLGTEDMRILYSPGFIANDPPRLENRRELLLYCLEYYVQTNHLPRILCVYTSHKA